MLASQNFTLPTLYGEPYLSKPPLYFWLTAVTGAARGTVDELTVRLPAVLAVLLGAWAVYGFARNELPRPTRAGGAAAAVRVHHAGQGDARRDRDVLLPAGLRRVVGLVERRRGRGAASATAWLWVGVLLGLAMLTKGPPALALFYVPVVAYLARQGRLRSLLCWAHPVALVFAVAPLLVWLIALRAELERWTGTGSMDFAAAMDWWRLQMGIEGFRAADTYADHLLDFPSGTSSKCCCRGRCRRRCCWRRRSPGGWACPTRCGGF